jgi:hypothetical protein
VAAFVLLLVELAVGDGVWVTQSPGSFGALEQQSRDQGVGLSGSSSQTVFLVAFVFVCTIFAIYQTLLIVLLVFIFRGHSWARIVQTIVLAFVGGVNVVQLLLGSQQPLAYFNILGGIAVLLLLWGGSAGRYFAARRAVAAEARTKAMAPFWPPPQ